MKVYEKSTDWTPASGLPGYETRLNESGHRETRPCIAEHMRRCICGLCIPESQSRTCKDNDRIGKLQEQRDELLAALAEIKKSKNWLAAWTIADHAIKKAGEAK